MVRVASTGNRTRTSCLEGTNLTIETSTRNHIKIGVECCCEIRTRKNLNIDLRIATKRAPCNRPRDIVYANNSMRKIFHTDSIPSTPCARLDNHMWNRVHAA